MNNAIPALRAISNVLLAIAQALLPSKRRAWAEAMRAEAAQLESGKADSLRWSLGCVAAASIVRLREPDTAYLFLLSGLCVGLVYLDWHTMETTATIAALVLIAAALGYTHDRRALVTGIAVGSILFVAHVLATLTGEFLPFYQCENPSAEDWLTVMALVGPGVFSALTGRLVRMWTKV